MKLEQRALRFPSGGNALVGIVDVPERPLVRGMLLLHDSEQYRTGSHRQFTLLSRLLAARGVAVLRFDRGASGDSAAHGGGAAAVEDHQDIASAMKQLFIHVPEMKETVILAASDAAGAAVAYAGRDARVSGLILLEPEWPGAQGEAAARHSAGDRLFRRASAFRRAAARAQASAANAAGSAAGFCGPVLVLGAGTHAMPLGGARCRHVALPAVDHACPRSAWRDAVALACASWLTSW